MATPTIRKQLVEKIALELYFGWVDQRFDCRDWGKDSNETARVAESVAVKFPATATYLRESTEKQWFGTIRAAYKQAVDRIEKRERMIRWAK